MKMLNTNSKEEVTEIEKQQGSHASSGHTFFCDCIITDQNTFDLILKMTWAMTGACDCHCLILLLFYLFYYFTFVL